MIFDKAFFVRWKNYPQERMLLVVRDKGSGFLYIPRHAVETGTWTPFISIENDISIMVNGKGTPEIAKEEDISMQLSESGELVNVE